MELSIAKEKFRFSTDIKSKVIEEDWVAFIESRQDYFTWLEDTEKGKKTLGNLDEIPESFREGILKGHNKSRAFAEFNQKKGYHEFYVDFVDDYGKVVVTSQKKITKEQIKVLLEMAQHLDALLLNNGNKIIDEQYLKV
jgi:hypothetical protein